MNRRLLAGCVVALTLALIGACACAGFAFVEIGNTVRQAKKDEILLAVQYSKIGQHADGLLTEVGSYVPRYEERTQRELTNIQTATFAVKKLADDTNLNLNGNRLLGVPGSLPALTTALASTNEMAVDSGRAITSASQRVNAEMDILDPALRNLAVASTSVATQTPAILANVGTSTQNLSTITDNGVKITNDGVKVADHYERVILAPVSKLKAAVLFGASVAQHLLGL